jgi:hypothetical protein
MIVSFCTERQRNNLFSENQILGGIAGPAGTKKIRGGRVVVNIRERVLFMR